MTDKFGLDSWPVSLTSREYVPSLLTIWHQRRYHELRSTVAWYRHLLMLKHAGRGHDPLGALMYKAGELAIDCIACIHVGKNTTEAMLSNIPDSKT
jgi:hypothetical protein